MRTLFARGLLLALLIATAAWTLGAAAPAPARRPATTRRRPVAHPARPARAAAEHFGGFSDSGVFVRYFKDQVWGMMAFRWQPDGTIETRTARGRPAAGIDEMRLTPDASGAWKTVRVQVGRDSAFLERVGTVAVLRAERRVDTLRLDPGTVLSGTPALLAQMPRAYSRSKRGEQKIPVLVVPMHQGIATVALLDTVSRTWKGGGGRLERWRCEMPGAHYVLWTDSLGRVCLADDAFEHFGFVRAGYEALCSDSTIAKGGSAPMPR